jgi:hypothetical protein
MLTQSRLKELFNYCPESGAFTRLASCKGVKAGLSGSNDGKGYLLIRVDGKKYKSHRLAFLYMTGEFPPHDVDHVNGVRDDNRWENLHAATRSENCKNQKLYNTNKSGYMGVGWNKRAGKWHARYRISNKLHHLGYFADINDAVSARATVSHLFHENHGRIV